MKFHTIDENVSIGTLQEWAAMEDEYLRCKHYLEADAEERKRIDKLEKREKLIVFAFTMLPFFMLLIMCLLQ